MPLVSVVIPTHQRPRHLERALASVAAQTLRDLEVFIIENGNSHEGEAIAQAWARRGLPVQYRHEARANVAHARNVGLRLARGTYIALLDDDDEWVPHKLERQVAVLERDGTLGLVASRAQLVDESGAVLDTLFDVHGDISLEMLVTRGCVIPSPSGVVFRRACVERVGYFNTDCPPTEDYEFWVRFSLRDRMVCIEEPLFRCTWHATNASRSHEKIWGGSVRILQSLLGLDQLPLDRETVRDAIRRYGPRYYGFGMDAAQCGQYGRAVRSLLAAIRCDAAVGRRVSWSRSVNPAYRILRPYAAVVLYAARGMASAIIRPRVHGASA